MANKIYDLLPVHLRNKELQTMFDSTLDRAFSKGQVDKVRAFIGRKEKGIYKEDDAYVSFPEHLFQRDNYGLEPVFSNVDIGDNIFYDDLLNSLYNKGALINDHRRLFKSDTYTVNLPIDNDKFINWELYYWVKPGFTTDFALYSFYQDIDGVYWRRELPAIIRDEPGTGLLDANAKPIDTYGSTGDYAVVISNNEIVYWVRLENEWVVLGSPDWHKNWPVATSTQNPSLPDGNVKFTLGNKATARISNLTQTSPVRLHVHNDDTHIHDDHIILDGNKIKLTLARGLTQLNDQMFYVKEISKDVYELYNDPAMSSPVDGTAFSAYEDGGIVERQDELEFSTVDGLGNSKYANLQEFVDELNLLGASIGISATLDDGYVNIFNDGSINSVVNLTGFSNLGIEDGKYRARDFSQGADRPKNPLVGDTFVDTDELRVTLNIGNNTYQLTDKVFDPYNVEVNPYALRFVKPDEGILHVIEYKTNSEFTTPDWEQYLLLENIFILGNSEDIHYITIDKDTDYSTITNWWSDRNSWYHYDDIRKYITSQNKNFIEQAKRPIIEFDKRLELSDESATATDFAVPTFRLYNDEEQYQSDYKIFHYVEDDDVLQDPFLGIKAKLQAGDYVSEFLFNIDMPINMSYKIDETYQPLYILSEFDYRNLRHEYGFGTHEKLELLQEPKNFYTIDVYLEGIKQIGNYTYNDNVITFNKPVEGYVYVDFTTRENVIVDGDGTWQRIDPSIEFNPDNLDHNNVEMSFSTVYEHLLRIVETTEGIEGNPNASNTYRKIGDNTDKLRFNKFGSVMVKNSIDITKAYFSITRDDYDPFASLEYISLAYGGYKNKLVTNIREILNDPDSDSKTDEIILEQAIAEIALAKRESINVFGGSDMINIGDTPNHYITANVSPVSVGSKIQFIPDSIATEVVYDENISVFINGVLEKNYTVLNGVEISFEREMTADDEIEVRYYKLIKESFIPPSATKLGIHTLYDPRFEEDTEFETATTFLVGHDGSKMPIWGDRTDSIMLMFEKLIYNRIDKTTDNLTMKNIKYGIYRDATIEYSFNEKKYTMFPFFKKWMVRNSIDNIFNTDFDPDNWKTWNYRGVNDNTPGNWRGLMHYVYRTENPLKEPWVTVGFSRPPEGFELDEQRYTTYEFWSKLKTDYNAYWPIPLDTDNNLLTVEELFFGSQISTDDIQFLDQDWEFGDGSPIEMAWRRSSEFPFIEFLCSMIMKPFEVIDNWSDELDAIISIYHKRESSDVTEIRRQKDSYQFKLGSKLGGFVNNFKLSSENSSLANSQYTEIPTDNYDLFIHTGEPNRSESFSAIVLEKVSLDDKHPTYSINNVSDYTQGTVIFNPSDEKYYRRKVETPTERETAGTINFDYTAWTLISQPKIRNFGYRIYGYDDFNPTFFAMDWDRTSGEKDWATRGDEATLNVWTPGTFYKNDTYVMYEGSPYISLSDHTASSLFNDDLQDNWKLLKEWPRVNQIRANGYKKTLQDQIKSYNYGDVLYSLDEVAHLIIGYQDYLRAVGWDFTDINSEGENIDFESLLIKFLDWSAEKHDIGEFITLTPILLSGRFSTPYGVATVQKETNKNFYRVVDSSGRQIPNTAIKFYSEGDAITWESTIPVYGMKIDITDVEHAYVIDRVDSYGDVIYDPLHHNRNLRMIIDCNRTSDWDGTLSADGYIMYDNVMIPNLETMVADTKYHRDTIVDQSLKNVNILKANQIGYTKRLYLNNHLMERESQLEFYKGFLAGKGTDSSVNRIVNKNSNFKDIKHEDMWAFKLGEYGNFNKDISSSKRIDTKLIFSDPYSVEYTGETPFKYRETARTTPIKTTGYVDSKDVNYIVRNAAVLETTVSDSYYEGDLAWIQFDSERDWDVRRLSEIAEISYVGETSDSQLYVALTNQVDIADTVYLKITNDDIDPEINGYYYLVNDGTEAFDDVTVHKYLVFDTDYEPVTVEIDSTTTNSIYVPTSQNIGVEAIGSNSNPILIDGETLVIDGTSFVYEEGTGGSSSGIIIGGTTATPDPIVSEGEQIRLVVYDDAGLIRNANTVVTFGGNNIEAVNSITSNQGDVFSINGTNITVDFSSTQNIEAISSITTSTSIATGTQLGINLDGDVTTHVIEDIVVDGSVNPVISETKSIQINGTNIQFTVPSITGSDTTEQQTNVSTPVTSLTLSTDMTNFLPGAITVDNGVDAPFTTTAYTYSNGVITFTSPIQDGQVDDDGDPLTPDVDQDGLVSFIINLEAQPVSQPPSLQEIIDTINNGTVDVVASNNGGALRLTSSLPQLELRGGVLQDLGISTSSVYSDSKLSNFAADVNTKTNVTSYINSSNRLVIAANGSQMILSGSGFNSFGFPGSTYNSTTEPTSSSVAQQINQAGISGVSATTVSGRLKIGSLNPTLTVTEVTTGAMGRLGFLNTTEVSRSLDNIISDINSVLSNTDMTATEVDRRLLISGNDSSVSISNLTGNPLDDFGIAAGEYVNTQSLSTSLIEFRDQINDQSSIYTASITSDGRFIISSSTLAISFSGTSELLLEKLGLYRDYTSIQSNANFKVMRWKSVRYTPGYNGDNFDSFYVNLGLNDQTTIWADEHNDRGWAVLDRSNVGNLTVKNRKAREVNVDLVKRMIIRDGTDYIQHQLFDPLNLKLPGPIMKDIDFVDWQDPAKYDEYYSQDLWLDEHLGEIWWDTNLARFYRYNDYGDANGNIEIDYVKRHWGKVVDGSQIVIKQWVENEVLPDGITWFNQEIYWDEARQKEVTKYYYWTDLGTLPRYNKEYSTDEIKMIIETGDIKDKFIPIDENTIVVSNKTQAKNRWWWVTTQYSSDENKQYRHSDWELLSRESKVAIMPEYLSDLQNSIADSKIENSVHLTAGIYDIDDEGILLEVDFLTDLTEDDIAVSVNNHFIDLEDFSIDGTSLRINNNYDVIVGDVVRVYQVGAITNNWFSDLDSARDNFKSIINDHFNKTLIEARYPFYKDYVELDHYIFEAVNWYINEDYKDITSYEFLSRTRNIDMITMFENGTRSFKIKNENYEEYYFGFGEPKEIRLVNKVKGALSLTFNDIELPGQTLETGVPQYYENIIKVQLHEFINMIYEYADLSYIKELFFGMLDYMYTEKTYPDWLFKTSYIDVNLYNKPLRQHAIYQRDSYNDTIEYLMEAKPYHVKLRDIKRIYEPEEIVEADVDAINYMNLHIDFGRNSRYKINTYDGGIEMHPSVEPEDFPEMEDGTYEQGGLLRRFYQTTADEGGYDTGLVESRILDSAIIRLDNFTDETRLTLDKKSFIVYDNLGRGHMMHVVETDSIDSWNNNILTVTDETKFRNAKAESVQIIGIEDTNGNIEFLHYDRKEGAELRIKDRALFNGIAVNGLQGDKIYIFSSPETMVFLLEEPDKRLL